MSGIEDGPALAILSGPQSGTRIPLDSETLIGSDARCRVRILGASPVHATVRTEGSSHVLYDGGSPAGVWLNDDRVTDGTPLRDGDIIWLGDPGHAGSSMLQCKLRGAAPAPTADFGGADSDFIMDEPAPAVAVDEFVMDEVAPSPAAVSPAGGDEVFFVSDVPSVRIPPPPPPPPPVAPAEDEAFFVADEPAPSWQPPSEPMAFTPAAPPPVPTTERSTIVQPPPPKPAPLPPEPPVAAPPAAAPAPPPSRPREVKTIAQGVPGTPGDASTAKPVVATPSRREPPRAAAPPSSRPTPRSSAGASSSRPAAPARLPRRSSSRIPAGYIFAAAGVIAVVALGAGLANSLFRGPSLVAVEPVRARLGDTITVTGKNFSSTAAQNEVLFGDMPGQVVEASPTELKVVVPAMRILAGEDTPLSVKVRVSGRTTSGLSLTVFDAPKIARVTPDVAMPGDTIEIEGTGWNAQTVAVRIGDAPAEIQSTGGNKLSVRVPALDVALGSSVPVVVAVASVSSAPGSLLLGRLPLVSEVAPARAIAGDVVRVRGRGFSVETAADQVRVAGIPALVFAASPTELQFVVPRVPVTAETASPLTVQVTSRPNPAEARITLAPGPDPLDFHFGAEPFVDAMGHEHAIVATELGPLFVLSASGGKSAALRAYEVAKAWNEAAVRLKASLEEDVETRSAPGGNPVLALRGRSLVLVEATDEDVAAYSEGWVKAVGPPVTKARLAAWWDALSRDLVLMLIRGRKPERTPALANEAKILVQLQERAQKTGRFGVPREVLNGMKPAEFEGLRALALRVPAAVNAGSAAASAAELAGPKLDGSWMGTETEGDRKRSITVTFNGRRGTLAYSEGIAVEMPVHDVELQKGTVTFNAEIRGGTRYYVGRWDGHKISGTINQEGGDARTPLGAFELSQ